MRYSATGIALLAFVNIVAAQMPHHSGSSRYFCGTPPPGWVPPGQRDRPRDETNFAACHALICARSHVGRRRGKERAD